MFGPGASSTLRVLLVLSLGGLPACGGSSSSGGGGAVPFRVDLISPADGGAGVSVNTTVLVTFSRSVSQTTVGNGVTFSVIDTVAPGSPLAGTITFDPAGRVLTFTPLGPLQTAATYEVQLTSGIDDTLGHPLDLALSLVPVPSTFATQLGPDTTPPIFGGATGAAAINDTSIQVSWNPAADDVDAPGLIVYNVYGSTVSGGQNFLVPDVTSAPGATSEVAGGLVPSTTYFLVVRAQDSSANEEANMVEVSAATTAAPDTIPPVFGGVTSTIAMSPTEVLVSWNAATDDRAAQGQIVYRVYGALASGGQNFGAPDVSTPPGATSTTVTGLQPGRDHFFVVRGVDPSGNEDANLVESLARTLASFTTQVAPIFFNNCAISGCHAGPNPQEGQNLSSFAEISATAINVQANETLLTSMLDRIEPFQSNQSYLIHKIDGTHLDPGVDGSGVQMPRGRPPLPQAERDLVRSWIAEGALNN